MTITKIQILTILMEAEETPIAALDAFINRIKEDLVVPPGSPDHDTMMPIVNNTGGSRSSTGGSSSRPAIDALSSLTNLSPFGAGKGTRTSDRSMMSTQNSVITVDHDNDNETCSTKNNEDTVLRSSMDFLSTPYAFDEHLFYANFPRCCDQHAREHLGHDAAYDAPALSTKYQDETPARNTEKEGEVVPPLSNAKNEEEEEEQQQQAYNYDHKYPRGHLEDLSSFTSKLRSNRRDALSTLKQINEITASKMDYDAARKVYLRIERKLHRNVLKAGARSEQSRLEVMKLKEQLLS